MVVLFGAREYVQVLTRNEVSMSSNVGFCKVDMQIWSKVLSSNYLKNNKSYQKGYLLDVLFSLSIKNLISNF